MDILSTVKEIALQSGCFEAGYLDIANLHYYPETRAICETSCHGYGATWACPPAVGTLEECRERVNQYGQMLLFSAKYELEDAFDFEGMGAGLRDFKRVTDVFEKKLAGVLQNYLLLSNEGCGRCKDCTYPDAPCRFPKSLHHSLEGYGFMVSELAKAAGIHYNNGKDTVTFLGALLFYEDAATP